MGPDCDGRLFDHPGASRRPSCIRRGFPHSRYGSALPPRYHSRMTENSEGRPPEGEDGPDSSVSDREIGIGIEEEESKFDYLRIGAGVAIGLSILLIGVFSLTDLSGVLLPMRDDFLNVLRPTAADDSGYPFVLNALENDLEGNTLSISGTMTNNSTTSVENVMVVIDVEETTGRFPATLEVPVDPEVIEPEENGTFSVSVTMRQRPNNYKVQFRLQNGPFVPHRDERAFSLDNAQPSPDTPIRLNIN